MKADSHPHGPERTRDPTMLTLLTIAGGVALILFGVRYLRKGLDRLFGTRLAPWMQKLAGDRIRAFFTGLGVAVMAPSSTTISFLAVQTVQTGQLSARRMLAVMLGADIGLTVTVQLIALHVEQYAPIFMLFGVATFQLSKSQRGRGIGQVLSALGLVFLGVLTIKQAASGIDPAGDLVRLIDLASGYPFLLAAIAALMAMALQSSTATIALVIGLLASGQLELPLSVAVAWVAGANVGIVLTTLIIGWSRVESRRLALGNLILKTATAVLVLAFLTPVTNLVAKTPGSLTNQVAHAHTGFNLALALAGLPLVMTISRLVERLVPEPAEEDLAFGPRYINIRGPVDSAALALGQSRREILHMSEITRYMLRDLWHALRHSDDQKVREVSERDDQVDLLDEQVKLYLTRVVGLENDPQDAAEQMRQLRYLAELETIGDIIDKNLCELVTKKINLQVRFSNQGWEELDDFYVMVMENMNIAETAFATRDRHLAQQLMQHKQRLDGLLRQLRDRHFARLNAGLIESHESSAIHLDLLTHLQRINSSVSHVAFAILQEPAETASAPEG